MQGLSGQSGTDALVRPALCPQDVVACIFLTLGMSFSWSLIRHAGISDLIELIGLGPVDAFELRYYALLALFGGLFALAMNGRAHRGLGFLRWACLAPCLAGSAAIAVCGLMPDAGAWLRWLALFIVPLSAAVLIVTEIAFCTVLARMNRQALLVCVLGSVFANIWETFAFADVFMLGAGATGWFPVVSAALLCFVRFDAAGCAPSSNSWGDGRAFLWSNARISILIGLLVFTTLMKSAADASFTDGNLRLLKHLVGMLEISLMLAMVNVVRPAGISAAIAYYVLVGSALVGAALMCAPASSAVAHVGSATMTTARVFAEALVLVAVAELIACGRKSFFRGTFLYFIFPEMLACIVAYGLVPALFTGQGVGALALVRCVGIFFMLALSLGLLAVICSRELPRLRGGNGDLSQPPVENAVPVRGGVAIEELARRFALTDREVTIASHLYRGHSIKATADEECISVNTVQSHSRSLYRKLGVHSRQELVDRIDSYLRQG